MTHKEYVEKNLLKRYLDSNKITPYSFAKEMNVPASNVYYWLKNESLYVEDDGIRKVILPRLVATARF